MAKMKSQFDIHVEDWAKKNDISSIIHNDEVFIVVDKYNKPLYTKSITKNGWEKLSTADKQKLESIKKSLPYENQYFSILFDVKNSIFLIRKKTPIQNILNVWAIIMMLWALYRWYFQTSLPLWMDEFITKPLVFILPIFFYIKNVEKKKFLPALSLHRPLSMKSIMTGIGIGVVFLVTGLISYYMKHQSVSISGILSTMKTPFLLVVLVSFATSISEEIVARGFVLKRLYEDSKNIYTSTIFTSILFFFMHIPILFTNENIVGSMLLQVMLTDLLFSFAVSFLYLETKNLYLAILIHALYNISIYLFSTN